MLLQHAAAAAAGAAVPYQVVGRRAGDTIAVWADPALAEKDLRWKATHDVADMCKDQWAWATRYPQVRARAHCMC